LDLTPDASAQSRKADVLALPKTADSKGSAGGKFSHDLEAVYGVAQARPGTAAGCHRGHPRLIRCVAEPRALELVNHPNM
jgi:hypothetical protein